MQKFIFVKIEELQKRLPKEEFEYILSLYGYYIQDEYIKLFTDSKFDFQTNQHIIHYKKDFKTCELRINHELTTHYKEIQVEQLFKKMEGGFR